MDLAVCRRDVRGRLSLRLHHATNQRDRAWCSRRCEPRARDERKADRRDARWTRRWPDATGAGESLRLALVAACACGRCVGRCRTYCADAREPQASSWAASAPLRGDGEVSCPLWVASRSRCVRILDGRCAAGLHGVHGTVSDRGAWLRSGDCRCFVRRDDGWWYRRSARLGRHL